MLKWERELEEINQGREESDEVGDLGVGREQEIEGLRGRGRVEGN